MGTFGTLDMVIFFGSLIGIMAVGLWAGRKEETSEDYFLAGRQTRWMAEGAQLDDDLPGLERFIGWLHRQ